MKKIAKIISSAIAVTMMVSAFAINSFAADARTLTLEKYRADGTTAIAETDTISAGETIVIKVVLDDNVNINACRYLLKYDTTAFSIDRVNYTRDSNFRQNIPAYIDIDWFEDSYDWTWYRTLSNVVFSPTTTAAGVDGQISMSAAGTSAIESLDQVENLVIGYFNFTAVDDIAAGQSFEFSIDESASYTGIVENGTTNQIYVDSSPITVATAGEVKEPASIEAPAGDLPKTKDYTYTTADGEFYNTGFDVSFDVTDGNFDVDGVEIKGTVTGDPQSRTEFSKKVELKTGIVAPEAGKEAVNVRFALNIKDVPSAVAIALTSLTPYVLAN